MSAGPTGDNDQPLSEINVTPLVDVMLVLLVIFIVLAPMFANALQIDLPRAQAQPLQAPVVVDLAIMPDGSIMIDGEPVTRDRLSARLRVHADESGNAVIRLNADHATPYQRVAEVMAQVKEAGVVRLAFAVKSPS